MYKALFTHKCKKKQCGSYNNNKKIIRNKGFKNINVKALNSKITDVGDFRYQYGGFSESEVDGCLKCV